jgi:LysM repeat protein
MQRTLTQGQETGRLWLWLPFLLVLGTSGCMTTYQDQRTRQAVAEREDMLLMREEMRRLAGRIEGVELELERARRQMDTSQEEQTHAVRSQQQQAELRLTALDRRIQEVDAARQKDRQDIIDQVAATFTQLLREHQSARPATASRAPRGSGYGYEHVVGAGETLSHIASAYGVSTRAIIDANDLSNPDRLRVGQTLFIPE